MPTAIREVIQHLEAIAPPIYQESYDNAGLITGDPDWTVSGVLCCLDSTEAVVEEAARKGCNLVVAHHPIVFKGLKRLTGKTYVERTVIAAIRHGIAIYAIHTNLDNVYRQGVNARIAQAIGLQNTRLLAPKSILKQATVSSAAPLSENLLLEAGAIKVVPKGQGNIWSCIFPQDRENALRAAVRAIGAELTSLCAIEDPHVHTGAGMIGDLPQPIPALVFLQQLKATMRASVVRHTALLERPVQRIAVCGGAGSFLLPQAIAQKADVFVTADYKYHEFFDAEGRIIIADIGHFESEQFTIDLLYQIISEKFRTFATHCTQVRTNPVFYL